MKTTSCTPLKDMTQPSRGLIPLHGNTESEVFTGHAVFRDNPFDGITGNYKVIQFIEGSTADQIVNLACIDNSWLKNYIEVKVGDHIVPRDSWHRVKLKKNAPIQLLVVAQGGGGGGLLGTIAMIAVVVIAATVVGPAAAGLMGFTAGTTAFAVASALSAMAFTMVASLAINAIFPPPSVDMPALGSPSTGGSGGNQEPDKFGWNSSNNTTNQYKPCPRVYGRVKVAPPYAARPYVEAVGDQQYIYLLFDFGYGPLNLEELCIGENPLSTFTNILYKVYPSFKKGDQLSYYNRDVYQETFSQKLTYGGWRTVSGISHSEEFVLDFSFPQGLCNVDQYSGNANNYSVDLSVQYRDANNPDWVDYYFADHRIDGGGFDIPADESQDAHWIATSGEYGTGVRWLFNPSNRSPDYEVFEKLPNPKNYPEGKNITLAKMGMGFMGWGPSLGGYQRTGTYTNYTRSAVAINIAQKIRVERATQKPFTVSLTMNLPAGDYEFRVSRLTGDSDDRYISDDVYLSSVRSIKNVSPIAPEVPHTIVEMKILATDQLNGMINNFSAIATSILPVWDGTKFTDQETRNPAWAYLDVLRGSAAIFPASLDRIDLNSFLDWANWCDKPALNAPTKPKSQCDLVVSGEYTAWQVLKMISSTGDGTPTVRSGKYSISIDRPKDYPVQLFTPRNSSGFSSNITYTRIPHALRVSFVDPDQNWQAREALVYDDGYDESNATEFQTMDLVGITTYEQAYRIGRRSIAQAKLRREVFTITTGAENVLATRGDLVRLSYDVPKIGVGWARITNISGNIITFDDELQLAAPKDYLRVRVSNDYQADLMISQVLNLNTLVVTGDVASLRVGQLGVYGKRQSITMDCLVKSVNPSADLSASLELVPYAEGIYSAEGKPIPPYEPLISNLDDRRVGPVVGLNATEIDTVINRYHYLSIALSWRPPVGVYPKAYDIYEVQDGNWVQIGTTKELSFYSYKDIKTVKDDGSPVDLLFKNHTFAVIGIGGSGGRINPNQAPQTTIKPVGDALRPQEPDYFELDIRSKETIYLEWSRSQSNDVDHYIIRYSPLFVGADFDKATLIAARVPWSSSSITVPARLGTYFIKTVDTFGNVSARAAKTITPTQTLNDDIALVRLEEPLWDGQLIGMDFHTETSIETSSKSNDVIDQIFTESSIEFPFYRFNKNIDDIPLDANGDLPFYEATGEYDPIPIDENGGLDFHKYGVDYGLGGAYVYKEIINMGQIYPIVFTAHIEANAIEDGSEFLAEDVAGQWDAWFEIRTAEFDPSNGGVWTVWRKFYAGEYTGQYFQFRICVASNRSDVGVRVHRAYVNISARVRLEGEYDVQCPAGGFDVVFDPPYKEQPSIGITQDNAQDGDRFSITNKSRHGFSIEFFDKAGDSVARQFDWISKGHGREVFEIPPYSSGPTPKTAKFLTGDSPYMESIKEYPQPISQQ